MSQLGIDASTATRMATLRSADAEPARSAQLPREGAETGTDIAQLALDHDQRAEGDPKLAAADSPGEEPSLRTGTMRDRVQRERTAAPTVTAPRVPSTYRFVYRSTYNYGGGGGHGGHVSVGVRIKLRPKLPASLPALELPQARTTQVDQNRWQMMRTGLDRLLADMRHEAARHVDAIGMNDQHAQGASGE